MSDTESDEDIKRAIALSLSKDPSPPRNQVVIDLVSSDEDDDLDAPITTRKMPPESVASQNKTMGQPSERCVTNIERAQDNSNIHTPLGELGLHSEPKLLAAAKGIPKPEPSISAGFLGLDRKKMEEERLQRASQRKQPNGHSPTGGTESRKRKASTSPPGSRGRDPPHMRVDLSAPAPLSQELNRGPKGPSTPWNMKTATKNDHHNKPQSATDRLPSLYDGRSSEAARAFPQAQGLTANGNPSGYASGGQAIRATGVQFPNGVVKKTWVNGCPRGEDIKIEEVLQKGDLELAVLSAFQIDPDWVASKLNPTTKVVFVLQAKTEAEKENFRSGAPSNYKFCFPSMEGNINCMHSKLQLLSHRTHLRVVVPSGNLVSYDWGETGVMENVCFLIDLPRLPEGSSADPELTKFGKELFYFVRAMGLDEKLVESMRRFDFSRTSHLAFVHSIGGSHTGRGWKRTGYCGLGTAVRSLALHTEEILDLDVLASSIGNLSQSFVRSIYLAAQGDDGMKEYGWRTGRSAKSKEETPDERILSRNLKDCFRIFFPTQETVAKSRGGSDAGGTICFQSKWYDADTFPRHLMRDCKSQRQGMLIHSKMLFVQPRRIGHAGHRGWAYVGSANMSESAWGRLVKDRSTKEPKLNCRNWECGVIVPLPVPASGPDAGLSMDRSSDQHPEGVEAFRGHVPVPMAVPGEAYGARRPWFYSEL